MKMIVFLHEDEISNRQYDDCDAKKNIMVYRAENHAERNDQLYCHINKRNMNVWHSQFIGHDLKGMFSVGNSKIFMKTDAVAYRKDRISTIHSKETNVGEITRLQDQLTQSENHEESHRYGTYVPGKTLCLLAEIEKAKHNQTDSDHIKIRHVDEVITEIKENQGDKNGKGISGSDTVDSIHEIICVHYSDTDHKGCQHHPPVMPVEDSKLIECQEHRHKLHRQSHGIRQGMDIIYKTDYSYEGKTKQKPSIFQTEKSGIEPCSE